MTPIDNSDYINGSWIVTSKPSEPDRRDSIISTCSNISFISCQGPLPHTCVHHLQLIHEQKIDVVIMLTRLVEGMVSNIVKNLKFVLCNLSSTICIIIYLSLKLPGPHNRPKCARYWPEHESGVTDFGHMRIKMIDESKIVDDKKQPLDEIIQRALETSNGTEGNSLILSMFTDFKCIYIYYFYILYRCTS